MKEQYVLTMVTDLTSPEIFQESTYWIQDKKYNELNSSICHINNTNVKEERRLFDTIKEADDFRSKWFTQGSYVIEVA